MATECVWGIMADLRTTLAPSHRSRRSQTHKKTGNKSLQDARCRATSPHQPVTPPSPSPRRRLWRNHPQSPAGNSAVQCAVNCQAWSKPRAAGTHVGVPFRMLTGIFVLVLLLVLVLGPTASITSTSTISLSTSTTEPTHRRVSGSSILRSRDHIFALVAEYLERFIEDRSKIGQLRTPRPS